MKLEIKIRNYINGCTNIFEFLISMYVNPWYCLGYSIHSKRTNDETRRIKERLP